jgi:hypothetical protein
MPLNARRICPPFTPVRADLVCSRVASHLACWWCLAPPVVSVFQPLRSCMRTPFLAFVRVGPLRCSLSCPSVPLLFVQRTGCSTFGLGYIRLPTSWWAPPMYIPLISVTVAAALILIFILLLRCASFFSSFSELVIAPCGLLALVFSISPLALSPLLSVLGCCWLPPPLCVAFRVLRFLLPLLSTFPCRLVAGASGRCW